ncbi:probable DNA-directed RNA polymerase, chain A [Thermoplasma acidophilum]|uniref:DNA-directed RNA polymerase subunit Rpo1N n=1 Tax=Thermoplasma acidophilum (strain ATCC 25905 / DSM 1728 / JCM 9062 / NBRC 15155 / AMRC-C165) TaxID=273075 RepID=RPO1N_THEAC|nr:DNA-directed RNA polymerase subunit A' [Thermoplasma acidophilum]Q03585.1 RecName: Full=DNA-directed RNA polymerase subunit Rpo1N; AltName: Full=DNA-directed RNA polymerase subunit A' [Thermoplasma acidophilum DSM 1728]CAA48281.1 DNA-directed RNA polymerase [Thermoplasma acidophilum]CAC11535.1 probable DNA-directed RNA polymerase, chain A [Thermoplasma acidophilum]
MMGISKRISSIKFALLSPDEIRKLSQVKVITADTYDDDGYPIEHGLMDLHMGVIEPGLRCATCGGKVDECPGHFGHIELAMPVVHVGFVKEIKMFLDATCRSCGRIKLTDDEIRTYLPEIQKMDFETGDPEDIEILTKKYVDLASQRMVCPHCGAQQSKIILDKPTTFREEGTNVKITPKEIRERLERIPDDDLIFFGFNPKTARPEWMVLTVLPVPPINVRPSITLETGERSEDDLTHKLVDIIRISQRLRESRDNGSPQLIIEDLWDLLQFHVTTYFDNQTPGIPPARHRSGRALKTLVQRLKGKEGRFRSNLSGKRVSFSSRTVISPEPYLSVNEVGVPERAARELTVPVIVNQFNIDEMRELIKRGRNPRDQFGRYVTGVNYVIRPDGRRIKITDQNAAENADRIDIGWTVERQLMEGDIVLFNRQPSLHRMSMMGHTVRILPGQTFRFNLAVCTPYNADFDGDEMNLHVIQKEEARAEARIIMKVQEQIMSPRFGGPIIGGIHDHVTALFLLTHNNPRYTHEEMVHIMAYLEPDLLPEARIENGEKYYYGRDIFSTILPKGLNVRFRSKLCSGSSERCEFEDDPSDTYVEIVDGKMIHGTIDEAAVSPFSGAIIDKIFRKFGSQEAARFIDRMTRLAVGFITYRGFSTGISDYDIPESAVARIEELVAQAEDRINKLIETFRRGELQPAPGRSVEDTLEMEILSEAGVVRDESGKIASSYLGLKVPSVIMARSGARATMLNISEVAGIVGQQSVRGGRLNRGYYNRTLPHFKRGDIGADARGFVRSSYMTGLSPTEYFFHSIGGREGLVDTAVRTSRSGYMQRRLINAFEDLKVDDSREVKDTVGSLIQIRYGEDGIDPTRSARGKAVDMNYILFDEERR